MKNSTNIETARDRIRETLCTAACCAESIARGVPVTVNPDGQLGFHAAIVEDMAAVPALVEAGRIDQLAALLDPTTLLMLRFAFADCNVLARHPGGGASRMM